MNYEIIRNYDIRGIYNQSLFDEDAFILGKAYGTILKRSGKSNIAVGYDSRPSSPTIYEFYKKGLLSTGIDVVELGECLTPLVKFYVFLKNLDAGTSITASHNPYEYNGFKIMGSQGSPFFGDKLQELKILIEKKDFAEGTGEVKDGSDLFPEYLKFIKQKFNFDQRNLRVAINCGNGVSGNFAKEVLSTIGVEVLAVNCPDNEELTTPADPEKHEFMTALGNSVIKTKSMMGFGLDLDNDRFGLTDEQGKIYKADKILMLFAKYFLHQYPKSTISFDVKCSQNLANVIEKYGGFPKIIRTGYPYHMQEVENVSIFSGEYSGHFFFGRKMGFFGFDDGIITACMILKIYDELTAEKIPLSQLMEEFPKVYHTSQLNIDCPDNLKEQVIETIIQLSSENDQLKNNLTDGVRASVGDKGWFLIRKSNTSPHLALRIEGNTYEDVGEIKKIVSELLKKVELEDKFVKDAAIHFS